MATFAECLGHWCYCQTTCVPRSSEENHRAYLIDYTECSLLLARNVVSNEAIEAALIASDQTKD